MKSSHTAGLLLVDDEENILKSLQRLFRRHGYTIYAAPSALQALKIMEEADIGVIISDMKMPGMSGTELLKAIAQKWPDTVRISLTGHADLQDTIEVINDARIFHYIGKPWDDNELLNVVRDAFTTYAEQLQESAKQESTSRMNDALKSYNNALKQEIKQTSVKLEKTEDQLANAHEDEKKLRLAREQAEQLSHAKSRFLATMSHEMRSPLNAIIAMNALLLQTDLNQEQRELAKLAHNGGQSLLSLINDVLDFSKIEAGMLQLNQAWFSFDDVVTQVIDLVASQATHKPIEIVQVTHKGTPSDVYGDEVRIRQILINLLSNAVKFTDNGGVRVILSKSEEGINIEVEDTGIGISAEALAHIFDDFFQADNSDSRIHGGTGLGLSICQKLVQLMKGNITVSSQLGKGSRFVVNLPLTTKVKKTPDNLALAHRQVYVDTQNHVLFSAIYDQLSAYNCCVFNTSAHPLPSPDTAYDHIVDINAIIDTPDKPGYITTQHSKIKVDTDNFSGKRVVLINGDSLGEAKELQSLGFPIILRKPLKSSALLQSFSENPPQDYYCILEAPESSAPTDTITLPINASILLAEDSPSNQAIVKAILKKSPVLLDIANDGEQALTLTKIKKYDVILMDLAMPKLDGLSCTRAIRNCDNANYETTIIAMTANAFPEDKKRCLDAGMNDYISKPIDVSHFFSTLASWLHKACPEITTANGSSTTFISDAVTMLNGEPSTTLDSTILDSTTVGSAALDSTTLDSATLDSVAISIRDNDPATKIDIDTLQKLKRDTSAEALPAILTIFFEETEKRIPLMLSYYKQSDFDMLANEAHTLKSSAGSFGGATLHKLAKDIEISTKHNDVKMVDDSMVNIDRVATETIQQLKQYLKGTSAKS